MRSSSRIAIRCTAPMKALRPPPTMPTRRRRPPVALVAGRVHHRLQAPTPSSFEIGRAIGAGGGEIVERVVGHLDDMVGDEFRALARRDFRVLQAALPLVDRPTGKIIGGELGEDRLEIDLPVA